MVATYGTKPFTRNVAKSALMISIAGQTVFHIVHLLEHVHKVFLFPLERRRRFGIIRAVGAGQVSGGKPTANFNNFNPS